MNKRINKLADSPCIKCGCDTVCNEKIARCTKLQEIKDCVFGNSKYDYRECPLFIALTAPELIEVDEW